MIILGVTSSSDKNIPAAPTIGTAVDVGTARAYNNGAATVPFTPNYSGGLSNTYTVTSSPGSFTASGASSPLTVTGLSSATAYTFTATATNSLGTSPASSASNSITATTVPQAPTIGTASDAGTGGAITVTFTPGATGGKAVTTYTATSSPGGFTGTAASSPITVSGLTTGTSYTFTVTATNANGTSDASAASNSASPSAPSFESIASVTYTTSAGEYIFNNIPQTYKHLLLVQYAKASNGAGSSLGSADFKFNNVTTANYNILGGIYYVGNASGPNYGSTNQTAAILNYSMAQISASFSAFSMVYILNYTSATAKPNTFYVGGMTNGASTQQGQMVSATGVLNVAQAVSRVGITFTNNISSSYGMSLFGIKG